MAANSQFAVAVHVMTILAKSCGERVRSGDIARSVNTNPVVIRRLLCGLQEAGLVVSQVGANGGTCLARPPEKICLSEVYAAVSRGEIFGLHPKTPNQDCPVGRSMAAILCNLQKEVDRTIGEKLSEYTLKDVIERVGA